MQGQGDIRGRRDFHRESHRPDGRRDLAERHCGIFDRGCFRRRPQSVSQGGRILLNQGPSLARWAGGVIRTPSIRPVPPDDVRFHSNGTTPTASGGVAGSRGRGLKGALPRSAAGCRCAADSFFPEALSAIFRSGNRLCRNRKRFKVAGCSVLLPTKG